MHIRTNLLHVLYTILLDITRFTWFWVARRVSGATLYFSDFFIFSLFSSTIITRHTYLILQTMPYLPYFRHSGAFYGWIGITIAISIIMLNPGLLNSCVNQCTLWWPACFISFCFISPAFLGLLYFCFFPDKSPQSWLRAFEVLYFLCNVHKVPIGLFFGFFCLFWKFHC